ncbi:MAG: alkaline phosphatase [Bacteroidales bacterium]
MIVTYQPYFCKRNQQEFKERILRQKTLIKYEMMNKVMMMGAVALCCLGSMSANNSDILIHSHNDYNRRVPLYQAYSQGIDIIEVDIFVSKNGKDLLVAHDIEDLDKASSIDELYIKPIISIFNQNQGKAWSDSNKALTLLIDLKSEYSKTLPLLIKKLSKYPEIFNSEINPQAVKIVISGNLPSPDKFENYPSYILFDGRPKQEYSDKQLERVFMISDSFRNYSQWNGKGIPVRVEREKLDSLVSATREKGKPLRFWAAPSGVTAWTTLKEMGVGIIGTDTPEKCASFFNDFSKKRFKLNESVDQDGVSNYNKLDNTTASFKGFNNSEMELDKRVEVYKPQRNNFSDNKVKNIILLIGDGMSLTQIGAAYTVNGNLSMLQMPYTGLMHTNAEDAFNTDSAGAGSSIATGKKNSNRHISMSTTGEEYETIAEIIHKDGLSCGVVTLGNVADATPAAFYSHTQERNDSKTIISQLDRGTLSLLCGSGKELFSTSTPKGYTMINSISQIDSSKGMKICIDERMGHATTSKTLSLLGDATKGSINALKQESDKGFFLMIEGAKIDYAGHANSLPATIMEMLSFDLAVGEALKFAEQDGNTLVLVTGDHETGGLTLIDGSIEKGEITAQFMTDDHTAVMLPLFAYGPGAEIFSGVFHNSDILSKIIQLLNK